MNLGKYKRQLRISRTCHTQSTMPHKEPPLWDKYCVNRQPQKSFDSMLYVQFGYVCLFLLSCKNLGGS